MLLTAHDIASLLQMNQRTVTLWLRNGRLRGFKIRNEWRVSDCDLEAFLETNANKRSQKLARSRSVAPPIH